MAGKNWQIEGKWAEFRNCNYGCPCETMAEPTYGHCTGLVAFKIDNGWCEDVRLDDLAVAATAYLPRALHHGQGTMQAILDERADECPARRLVLHPLRRGPAGRHAVPNFLGDDRDDQRSAVCQDRVRMGSRKTAGADRDARPHPSAQRTDPEPGDRQGGAHYHRAPQWLDVPRGQNVSGFAKSMGAIKFDLNGRHSSLAHIAWNQNGMLHTFNEYKRRFGRP